MPAPSPSTLSHTFTINQSSYNLVAGEQLYFRFQCVSSVGSNFTASIDGNASLTINSLAASTGYTIISATPTSGYFDSASMANTGSNTSDIVLSSALSNIWGKNYIFVPNPLSGSISSLYSGSINYGDVDYAFAANSTPCGDIAVIYLNDGTYFETRIINEYFSGSFLHLALDSPLSTSLRNALANQTYQRFLLLSRVKDETNIILNFTKRVGKSSNGIVIPGDINANILDNIDTITKEIKQKVLGDTSIVSGSFGY
jgi:hypothetical protein